MILISDLSLDDYNIVLFDVFEDEPIHAKEEKGVGNVDVWEEHPIHRTGVGQMFAGRKAAFGMLSSANIGHHPPLCQQAKSNHFGLVNHFQNTSPIQTYSRNFLLCSGTHIAFHLIKFVLRNAVEVWRVGEIICDELG